MNFWRPDSQSPIKKSGLRLSGGLGGERIELITLGTWVVSQKVESPFKIVLTEPDGIQAIWLLVGILPDSICIPERPGYMHKLVITDIMID